MKKYPAMRSGTLALAAVATFGLTACGDSTGPDGPGKMDVVMHDGSAQSSVVPSSGPARQSGSYSGTFEGEVEVQVSADGETWVDVSPPASADVELNSDSRTTLTSEADVDAGSYSRVRVIMRNASAQIASGATIGGTLFDAALSISVGSSSEVVVEKEVFPFTVNAESEIVLSVDLNSEAWVNSQSAESGTAASSEIQSATTVEARRK